MIERKTSKEILADSLSQLLQGKPFDKITVTEIAANCGIAKRTFYYYFKDKYELALWFYVHSLDRYYCGNQGAVTFRGYLSLCVETIWQERTLIQNILQYSGQNNFRRSVYEPLVDRFLQLIREVYGDPITPELRETVKFYVGGLISYAEDGLLTEAPHPSVSIPLFEACVPSLLRKYLDDPER